MPLPRRHTAPLAVLALVPLMACENAVAPERSSLAPAAVVRATAAFNPQPEPPARLVLPFEARGAIDGRMTGRIELPGGVGDLLIVIVDSRPAGRVLHVDQLWEIHPPDPIEPFQVRLRGVLNRSKVVLNGSSPAGQASVRAELDGTTLKGDLSIVGFNPQPEPPAIR